MDLASICNTSAALSVTNQKYAMHGVSAFNCVYKNVYRKLVVVVWNPLVEIAVCRVVEKVGPIAATECTKIHRFDRPSMSCGPDVLYEHFSVDLKLGILRDQKGP